jgi:hypothetical protein
MMVFRITGSFVLVFQDLDLVGFSGLDLLSVFLDLDFFWFFQDRRMWFFFGMSDLVRWFFKVVNFSFSGFGFVGFGFSGSGSGLVFGSGFLSVFSDLDLFRLLIQRCTIAGEK